MFWIKNLWMGNLLHFYRTMTDEESLVLNKISASVRLNSLRSLQKYSWKYFLTEAVVSRVSGLHINCGYSMASDGVKTSHMVFFLFLFKKII